VRAVRAAAVLIVLAFLGADLSPAAQEIEIPRPADIPPTIETRTRLDPRVVELSIIEIRPALRATTGAFPIEVVVKNGGSRAVHVRPAAVVVSRGGGRITHGPGAPLEAGGVASLGLDLPMGSDGPTRCGERLPRTIWLEVRSESPLPGYRRGNEAGSPWSVHRDRSPEDDRREVAIRIDCSLEVR